MELGTGDAESEAHTVSDLLVFSLLSSQMSKLRETNSCFFPITPAGQAQGFGAVVGGRGRSRLEIGGQEKGLKIWGEQCTYDYRTLPIKKVT